MAVDALVHANTESKVGLSQEATFGTAIADNGTFVSLEADIPTGIDYGLFQDINAKNTGSRVKENDQDFHTEAGGLRVISLTNWKPRRTDLAELAYSCFQNVSEGVTTPFTKTFTWDGSQGTPTTQPNFASNAGYFFTLGVDEPIASFHKKWTSCIARSLTFTSNMTGGGDGRLMGSAEIISGFTTAHTANFSGTWSYAAQPYYYFNQPSTLQLNSLDLVVYGFTVTFVNNAVRVGNNSSGNAQTYGLPLYQATGSVTAKYDTKTQGIIADFLAGTSRKLQIATGTPASAGHFDITLNAIVHTGPAKDYGRAEGQAITFPFEALYDSGGNPLATLTISDALDQTW